jgi:hypothetical protein
MAGIENLIPNLFVIGSDAGGASDRIADVARVYRTRYSKLMAAKKNNNGHIPADFPTLPSDIKTAAQNLLRECYYFRIPPPQALVELNGELLAVADESRRRSEPAFPLAKARKVKAQTRSFRQAAGEEMPRAWLSFAFCCADLLYTRV